jgi:hypothetical protein
MKRRMTGNRWKQNRCWKQEEKKYRSDWKSTRKQWSRKRNEWWIRWMAQTKTKVESIMILTSMEESTENTDKINSNNLHFCKISLITMQCIVRCRDSILILCQWWCTLNSNLWDRCKVECSSSFRQHRWIIFNHRWYLICQCTQI